MEIPDTKNLSKDEQANIVREEFLSKFRTVLNGIENTEHWPQICKLADEEADEVYRRNYKELITEHIESGDQRFVKNVTKERIIQSCSMSEKLIVIVRGEDAIVGFNRDEIELPDLYYDLKQIDQLDTEWWSIIPEKGSEVTYEAGEIDENENFRALPFLTAFESVDSELEHFIIEALGIEYPEIANPKQL